MNDLLSMWHPPIFEDMSNVTSSLASEDGPMRFGSQDGRMTNQCGLGVARASLSPKQASGLGLLMNGISGPRSIGSSSSHNLQKSLESRLQARMGKYGSPECNLIWSKQVIGLQAQTCVLRASPRLTIDPVTFLWPTPQARDYFPPHRPEYIAAKRSQGHGMSNLPDCVALLLCLWPTPTAITNTGGAALCKWGGTRSREKLRGAVGDTVLNGALNPAFPSWLMGYAIEWENCADLVTLSSRKSQRNS